MTTSYEELIRELRELDTLVCSRMKQWDGVDIARIPKEFRGYREIFAKLDGIITRHSVAETQEPLAVDIIKGLLTWCESGIPNPPDHSCGPEGNCDDECVAWAYLTKDIQKARAYLASLPDTKGGV